jgi:ribonuclease P/MRP protein subunit RPP40
MLPGKKAFDRIIWAFKNVLNASLAWLFYDLRSPNLETVPNALAAHSPTIKTIKPDVTPLRNALLPTFKSQQADDNDEESQRDDATELLEWLSLAMARSPRILSSDSLDPYLCRYRPAETSTPANLTLFQWRGFAPAAFVQKILLAATKASVGDEGWFALGGAAFSGEGYMILRDGGEVRTWKYSD